MKNNGHLQYMITMHGGAINGMGWFMDVNSIFQNHSLTNTIP